MIVVTGASGLLGANLLLYLLQQGIDAVGLYHSHSLASGIQIDLRDEQSVGTLLKQLHPTCIIHCAALTNVDWCEQHHEEAFQLNMGVSQTLARTAKLLHANMVYISTDSVFDGISGYYGEEDEPKPINRYAESKLAGEKAVVAELEHYLIIRTNIYGWNLQDKTSLAEWILYQLQSGKSVPGFFDVTFAPILVNDLSEIIFEMLSTRMTGIYHVNGCAQQSL